MSEQFKVGDVVTLVADPALKINFREYIDGKDVEVIGSLARRLWSDGIERLSYVVLNKDGTRMRAAPHELRRKQPPKPAREIDTKVSWDECAWIPMCVKLDRAIERAKQDKQEA